MPDPLVIVAYCCFALGGLLLIGAFIRLFVWMCGNNKEKSKFNMRYWVNKPDNMKVVSAKSGKAMKGNLEGDDDSVHIEFDAIYAEASEGAVRHPIRELSEPGEPKPYMAKGTKDTDPLYSVPIKPKNSPVLYNQPVRPVRPSLSYSEEVEYPVPPVPIKRNIFGDNDSELNSNKSARGSSINQSDVSSEQHSAPSNEQLISTSGDSPVQKLPNDQSGEKPEAEFRVENEAIETISTLANNKQTDPENLETPLVENITESDSEKGGIDSPFYDDITGSTTPGDDIDRATWFRRLDSDTSSAFCEPRDACERKFSEDSEYARPIMAVQPSVVRT